MLFVDYSSAINAIFPSKLTTKHCRRTWDLAHAFGRGSSWQADHNSWGGQTCLTLIHPPAKEPPAVLNVHLWLCGHFQQLSSFTDDTVVLGLISDNNEKVYLEEIKNLENWWQENNLHQNVSKTKEKKEQEEKIPPP